MLQNDMRLKITLDFEKRIFKKLILKVNNKAVTVLMFKSNFLFNKTIQ